MNSFSSLTSDRTCNPNRNQSSEGYQFCNEKLKVAEAKLLLLSFWSISLEIPQMDLGRISIATQHSEVLNLLFCGPCVIDLTTQESLCLWPSIWWRMVLESIVIDVILHSVWREHSLSTNIDLNLETFYLHMYGRQLHLLLFEWDTQGRIRRRLRQNRERPHRFRSQIRDASSFEIRIFQRG